LIQSQKLLGGLAAKTINKFSGQQASFDWQGFSAKTLNFISPRKTADSLQILLILSTSAIVIYWLMKLLALPLPGKTAQSELLISSKSGTEAYLLFGGKQIDTGNIKLRGVIHMDDQLGLADGFAIFEVDGKTTPAIGRGESLGQGFVLSQINKDSVVISRQGQRATVQLLNEKQKKSIESKR
jgi:hypothetical protein